MDKYPPQPAQPDLFKNDLDNVLQQDTQDLREMFSSLQPNPAQPQRGNGAKKKGSVSADVLRQQLHQRVRQAKRDLQAKDSAGQVNRNSSASTNRQWAETAYRNERTAAPTVLKEAPPSKVKAWLKVGVVLCVLFAIGIGAGWAALKLPVMRQGAQKQQPTSNLQPQASTPLTTATTQGADAVEAITPSGSSAEFLGDAQALEREESIALKRFFSHSNQKLQRSLDDAVQLTTRTQAKAPLARNDGLRPNPLRLGMVGPNQAPAQQQAVPVNRQQRLAGKTKPATTKALPNAIRSNAKRLSKRNSSVLPNKQSRRLGNAQSPVRMRMQPTKKRLNTQKTTFVPALQAQPKLLASPMLQTRQFNQAPKAPQASVVRLQHSAQKMPPQPTKVAPVPMRKPAAKQSKTWLLQVGACQAQHCIADYRKVLARRAPNRSILVTHGWVSSDAGDVRVQRIQVMVPSKKVGMQLKARLKSHDSRFGYAYLIAPGNAN